MAKKNLIISGFTGYDYEQIRPYVLSIRQNVSANTDLVMAVGRTDDATRQQLEQLGWRIISMPETRDIPIHVMRFLPIYDFLRENVDQYDFVVSTDVKDVVFQTCPFVWLKQHLTGQYHLVAGSEALKYCDEPWGCENLYQAYGGYVWEQYLQKPIYNVGTLGGHAEYMRDLFFNLFYGSLGKPIPIVDQAVFNVLIHTLPYKDHVFFAEQRDGWACQAGTVADPQKMHQFRPCLLEPEPLWENNLVYTGSDAKTCKQGTEFVIVHQYDRVPHWRYNYLKKYEK